MPMRFKAFSKIFPRRRKSKSDSLEIKVDQPAEDQVGVDYRIFCGICGYSINTGDSKLNVDHKFFHYKCFRCVTCDKQMQVDDFFLFSGKRYCEEHYKVVLRQERKMSLSDMPPERPAVPEHVNESSSEKRSYSLPSSAIPDDSTKHAPLSKEVSSLTHNSSTPVTLNAVPLTETYLRALAYVQAHQQRSTMLKTTSLSTSSSSSSSSAASIPSTDGSHANKTSAPASARKASAVNHELDSFIDTLVTNITRSSSSSSSTYGSSLAKNSKSMSSIGESDSVVSPSCLVCKELITPSKLAISWASIHSDCYVCTVCGTNELLKENDILIKDSQFYCSLHISQNERQQVPSEEHRSELQMALLQNETLSLQVTQLTEKLEETHRILGMKETQWESQQHQVKEKKIELVQKVTLMAERLALMREIAQAKDAEIVSLREIVNRQQSFIQEKSNDVKNLQSQLNSQPSPTLQRRFEQENENFKLTIERLEKSVKEKNQDIENLQAKLRASSTSTQKSNISSTVIVVDRHNQQQQSPSTPSFSSSFHHVSSDEIEEDDDMVVIQSPSTVIQRGPVVPGRVNKNL